MAEGTADDSIVVTRFQEWDVGGGVRFVNGEGSLSFARIEHCGFNEGSGITCHWSSPVITNCTISENSARSQGGGIYFYECSDSPPIISDCIISGNSAKWGGAGISFFNCDNHPPIVSNCIISLNSITGPFGDGGGINCFYSSPTIMNCRITLNTANTGGGIRCLASSPIISNCTITGNRADYDGGAIYCQSSFPTFLNCILWNDSPEEVFVDSGNPIITYSDVQGGWEGEGNIDEDPLFTLKSWFGFDYGLRTSSPCIDSGDPTIEDDIYDWHPLCPDWYVNCARSDMGAYGGPGNTGWFR